MHIQENIYAFGHQKIGRAIIKASALIGVNMGILNQSNSLN